MEEVVSSNLIDAFLNILQGPQVLNFLPVRVLFLFAGTFFGLIIGIIPGLGGLVGLAILLPFTFSMEPFSAFVMLMGLLAVKCTSDTIPAVFFAVPGTVGSTATILDGHPMARKGEAGRALSAAFFASMLGGIFGATILVISIPIIRPIVLAFCAPEFFMLGILGIVMVGSLSADSPLKGVGAGFLGLMLGMVGMERFRGIPRWTFGELYLWDGVGIVVAGLGLFAIPEIIEMVIKGTQIADEVDEDTLRTKGALQGIKDVIKNWFLVVRCSALGAILGALPGVGVTIINWLAYGHAKQTCKGADKTFGKGDVRGVIAPEASNNAKEGGALIPTLAFGIPGSPTMALVLGALMIQGIVPGPNMLTENLDLTYTMVWALVIANIIGAVLCIFFTNSMAKLSLVRIHIIAPLILATIYLAAFQEKNSFSDLTALLIFSLIGWYMKRYDWSRPALILGLVLATIIENNFLISIKVWGATWLYRPIVLVVGVMVIGIIVAQVRRNLKIQST